MISVLLRVPEANRDEVLATLWEHGTVGIIEEFQECLRAFFPGDVISLADLNTYSAECLEMAPVDRDASPVFSREDWDPVLVGNRFFVAPSWVDTPTPGGRIRLVIDSATAFGTGRHETTQLVLEVLECMHPGQIVADIGCGSGILSLGAVLLGAGKVIGCDIDNDVLRTARESTALNSLFVGACDAIRSEAADIVLANISARVVDQLAPDLNRITKPNGILVLSGFVSENPPRSFAPMQTMRNGDWECWICRPEKLNTNIAQAPTQPFSLSWW